MSHFQLLKLAPNVPLAHLYEHLFAHQVTIFLRQKQLLHSLDYELEARTYGSGLVHIDIWTPKMLSDPILDRLEELDINYDASSLKNAMHQIVAEKEIAYWAKSYNQLCKALKAIQDTPWQAYEEMHTIDTRYTRRSIGVFRPSNDEVKVKRITASLIFPQKDVGNTAELNPLFIQLAYCILGQWQTIVADRLGIYSETDKAVRTAGEVGLSTIFKMSPENLVTNDALAHACVEAAHYVVSAEAIQRLLEKLNTADHMVHPQTTIQVYEKSHIAVGAKGWSKIATHENCKTILENTTVVTKLGNKKTVLKLIQ